MPTKIRVLNEQTINEIAAGEVIENPASVVKELVENSIDASSKNITIEIRGGGRQLIRITDDGCGMGPDDALLSLERHATSKISSSHDIFNISTLGFRGEAVPSIASISKFSLLTCDNDSEKGTLIIVDGGKVISASPAARSQGTTTEVKQLFFNVPVRKKFQRSPIYDAQEIEKICVSFAMANPLIHFHLISNDETILKTTAHGKEDPLSSRIKILLGSETWEQMLPINASLDGFSINGYIGLPTLHRPNKTGQFLFVNGRCITAPLISFLIKENFGTMLPSNRHPVFVLSLTLPPSSIDVNVHPQKREVRFSSDCCLKELLQSALNQTLHPAPSAIEFSQPCSSPPPPSPSWTASQQTRDDGFYTPPPAPKAKPFNAPLPWDTAEPPSMTPPAQPSPPVQIQQPLPIPETDIKPLPRLLATLQGYLLIDGTSLKGSMLEPFQKSDDCAFALIDQRRAHHRIIYEKLAEAKKNPLAIQSLLIPHTLHLSHAESQLMSLHQEHLHSLGIEAHSIGPQLWSVESLPSVIGNVDVKKFIDSLLETLRKCGESSNHLALAEKFSSAAIAASISQQKKLAHEEGLSLLQQLCRCKQPLHCPNGKSIFVTLSLNELQKRFNQ